MLSSFAADVRCTEERTGRPYSLVVTKQHGEYKRQLRQYEKAQAALKQLRGLLPDRGGCLDAGTLPLGVTVPQSWGSSVQQ